MRETTKIRLRHGYLGALTKAQIARANGVSEITVERFWRGEKAAGVLPAVRPHFAEQTTVPAPRAHAVGDPDDMPDADEPPAPAPLGDMLAALRQHHADLDRAGAQEVSRDLLRFDLKGMPLPMHGMLMAICRAADANAAARKVLA